MCLFQHLKRHQPGKPSEYAKGMYRECCMQKQKFSQDFPKFQVTGPVVPSMGPCYTSLYTRITLLVTPKPYYHFSSMSKHARGRIHSWRRHGIVCILLPLFFKPNLPNPPSSWSLTRLASVRETKCIGQKESVTKENIH